MSQAMPQAYETLLLERRNRVALITINRPDKRNALNIKTREEGAALAGRVAQRSVSRRGGYYRRG